MIRMAAERVQSIKDWLEVQSKNASHAIAKADPIACQHSKDMLDLLHTEKPVMDESRKYWPHTPTLMTTVLARSGPAFSKIGWTVEDLGSRNKDKIKRWRLSPPQPWTPISKPSEISGQWAGYNF